MYSVTGKISLNRRERPAASYPVQAPKPRRDLYPQYRHSIQNFIRISPKIMWIRTLRQYTSFNCCTDFAVQYRHTLLFGTSLRTTCGGSCFPHMVLQASSSPRRRSIARDSRSECFTSTYTSCAAPSLLTGTLPLSPEKSCYHIIQSQSRLANVSVCLTTQRFRRTRAEQPALILTHGYADTLY